MLNSAKFRHIVEIIEQEKTDKKNKLGEQITRKVVKATIFASFENKTGNMLYGRAGDSKLSNTTHKISYRYENYPYLKETQTIRINNQNYNIEYIDDLDNKHEIIEVFLSRDNLRRNTMY